MVDSNNISNNSNESLVKDTKEIKYDASVSEDIRKIIEEEYSIFFRVRAAVRKQAILNKLISSEDISNEILELREEALSAHSFDLPAFLQQIEIQKKLLVRKKPVVLPDLRSAYFAHLRLKDLGNGSTKDILIGHQTFIDNSDDIKIVDWRNAPIARIFFDYKENDFYEESMPGKDIRGQILIRNIVSFEKGNLIGIKSLKYNLVVKDGVWFNEGDSSVTLKGGEKTAVRGFSYTGKQSFTPEISALLDSEQYKILSSEEGRPLLILGSAGCGKTTVALHRISALFYNDPVKYAQHKQLVLVPTEGLVRLSKKLLSNLKMEKVRVMSFDDWMSWQCRYLIKDLPSKIIYDTPPRVSKFKKDIGILKVLPLLEKIRIKDFSNQIKDKLYFIKDAYLYFENSTLGTLVDRISQVRNFCLRSLDKIPEDFRQKRMNLVNTVMNSLYQQVFWIARDRVELLTNKYLLEEVVKQSDNLQPSMVQEVYNRGLIQFSESTEDVPEEYTPVDEKGLDEDTPFDLSSTIDIEDFSIMLSILKQYTGSMVTPGGTLHKYSHVVLDEAQELGKLDLNVIASSLEDGASVSIAGDRAQHTDETSTFSSWEDILSILKQEQVDPVYLKTNYRTTKQIFEYAVGILKTGNSKIVVDDSVKSVKEGPNVSFTQYFDEGVAYLELKDVVEELLRNEPDSSLAIICKTGEKAEAVYDMLKDLNKVRLVLNGEFEFKPGVDVTVVSEIKGLEFDYVIIPDADSRSYLDTDEDRRTLHVAVSRAIHQLWVMSVGVKSFILPKIMN